MNFTSFEFVFFLFAVLLLRTRFHNDSHDKWLLLVASIAFYLVWSMWGLFLLLLICLVDQSIGKQLGKTADVRRRKRLLIASVSCNLGLLGFFKYTNFFLENACLGLNAIGLRVPQLHYEITIPPGISYFTFSSMSYVIDVYNKRLAACGSIRDYVLFVSFFPKLLSGPIVRAVNFLPQLKQRTRLTAIDVETGLAYVLLGSVKKLVIADQIAGNVNLIFSAPAHYDGFTLLQGVLGYAVQIYCDFSGYSDMAVGVARLLGFQFPENFQMPFSSVTITEYWRRWHITMSSWFRDYVFFPLEVASKHHPYPTIRAVTNVTVTMLLCGLWHGAGWNFVLWGGINGLALGVHVVWMAWNPLSSFKNYRLFQVSWTFLSRFLTLGIVLMSLVCFRTESITQARHYLTRMLSWSFDGTRLISPYIVPAVICVFLAHVFVQKDRNWAKEIPFRPLPVRLLVYSVLALLLVSLAATDAAPFIYFQF